MVPDHCQVYALSSSDVQDYKKSCNHEHILKCDRCSIFPSALKEIRAAVKSVECSSEEREEMEYTLDQSAHNIEAWKAHLLRSINQDAAKRKT